MIQQQLSEQLAEQREKLGSSYRPLPEFTLGDLVFLDAEGNDLTTPPGTYAFSGGTADLHWVRLRRDTKGMDPEMPLLLRKLNQAFRDELMLSAALIDTEGEENRFSYRISECIEQRLVGETLEHIRNKGLGTSVAGGFDEYGLPMTIEERFPPMTLSRYIVEHGNEQNHILYLLGTAMRTMSVASENGLLHRDLKCGNMIVTRPGIEQRFDSFEEALTFDEHTPLTIVIDFHTSRLANAAIIEKTTTYAGVGFSEVYAPRVMEPKNRTGDESVSVFRRPEIDGFSEGVGASIAMGAFTFPATYRRELNPDDPESPPEELFVDETETPFSSYLEKGEITIQNASMLRSQLRRSGVLKQRAKAIGVTFLDRVVEKMMQEQCTPQQVFDLYRRVFRGTLRDKAYVYAQTWRAHFNRKRPEEDFGKVVSPRERRMLGATALTLTASWLLYTYVSSLPEKHIRDILDAGTAIAETGNFNSPIFNNGIGQHYREGLHYMTMALISEGEPFHLYEELPNAPPDRRIKTYPQSIPMAGDGITRAAAEQRLSGIETCDLIAAISNDLALKPGSINREETELQTGDKERLLALRRFEQLVETVPDVRVNHLGCTQYDAFANGHVAATAAIATVVRLFNGEYWDKPARIIGNDPELDAWTDRAIAGVLASGLYTPSLQYVFRPDGIEDLIDDIGANRKHAETTLEVLPAYGSQTLDTYLAMLYTSGIFIENTLLAKGAEDGTLVDGEFIPVSGYRHIRDRSDLSLAYAKRVEALSFTLSTLGSEHERATRIGKRLADTYGQAWYEQQAEIIREHTTRSPEELTPWMEHMYATFSRINAQLVQNARANGVLTDPEHGPTYLGHARMALAQLYAGESPLEAMRSLAGKIDLSSRTGIFPPENNGDGSKGLLQEGTATFRFLQTQIPYLPN